MLIRPLFLLFLLSFWILPADAGTLSDLALNRFEKIEQGISISVYELKNEAHYFQPAVKTLPAVAEFQKRVQEHTSTDPYFLLRRQMELFLRVGMKEIEPKFRQALRQDIPEISFLEQMLFELHQEKLQRPLFGSYSEFGAHVLIGSQDELVIVFVSNPHDAMVPSLSITVQILETYLDQGFKYYTFIHNHPFNFDNPYDSGGTTVPSGNTQYGDVSAFIKSRLEHGLQNAWVTNGFNTIRIPSSDFEKY